MKPPEWLPYVLASVAFLEACLLVWSRADAASWRSKAYRMFESRRRVEARRDYYATLVWASNEWERSG